MNDELRGKTIKNCWITVYNYKIYSYLIDDDSEDKKAKGTTKCVVKRKLKFEICKSRLEVTQLKNKINHLEKNETEKNGNFRKKKDKKLISKTHQKLKSERHKFLLKKLITFLEVQMMIKEGNKLIQYKFICNKRLNVAI